jgi:cyclin-dependent kinase-like
VKLLQVFREEERLFLVFEFVERTLLEELETSPEGLPIDKLKYLTYQMLKALYFMHSHDLIHRDVKPENLLVS